MLNKISDLKMIVYDFDGVMTDNKVYLSEDGKESVRVNRADGLAISEIKKMGLEQIIISTEVNFVVATRANKIGIKCIQGVKNKKNRLITYCNKHSIDLKNVLFIGNDINDKEVMEIVGFAMSPADAHKNIKKISNYVLKSNGGDGVIRELMDLIINNQNKG